MLSINLIKRRLRMMLLGLSLMAVMSCSVMSPSPTWPTKLKTIQLSDGGICLSPESALRLAEFRAELEAY